MNSKYSVDLSAIDSPIVDGFYWGHKTINGGYWVLAEVQANRKLAWTNEDRGDASFFDEYDRWYGPLPKPG